MIVLWTLLALQGVFIGGHMAKSMQNNHGIESIEEVAGKNAGMVAEDTASEHSNQEFLRSIAFHPSSVDFGVWSVGTARSYLVTLVNKNANKSVHLSSISGNTQEFYSSFFEDKVVPPHANTTFNVVFLPRSFGLMQTDLFIHTSFGQARLPVRGEGKECPYRIKSLVGIRAPFNATISPEIHMYNPHPRPIQILEIYSSGGQFQLELPSGGQEGPQALWEIPSHTAKPIIRIKFHASHPGNHTAFIRIKISETLAGNDQKEETILVIPVEIEISEDTGLYSANPVLDFGRLTTLDSEKILHINLINSGKHTYQGLEYRVENAAGLVELDKSDLTLRIHPELATQDLSVNGLLLVRMWRYAQTSPETQSQQKYVELSVGVRAEIYKGSLEFAPNQTVFITGAKGYKSGERSFPVQNSFSTPIAVVNMTIDSNDTSVFRISGFQARVIPPSGTVNMFSISVVNESATFKTSLKIHTNLSTYELPIIVCSGLLTHYTSLDPLDLTPLTESNVLNFGAVQYKDFSHNGYILLRNPNPIPVSFANWNFKSPSSVYYHATFLGCIRLPEDESSHDGELTDAVPLQQKFAFCMNVSTHEVAAFQLAVQSFAVKSFTSVFLIWTEYEAIETTINFVVVMGRLEVDQSRMHFAECFPGKRCSADISIHSTFVKSMQVNSITVSVPGLVFEYHTQEGLPEIVANAVTDIGRIHFDPKTVCGKRCYILPDGADDVASPAGSLELDEAELRRRTEMFRRFKYNLQMITFTLNTSEIRLHEFNATVDIVWPKLVQGHQMLPAIEIGQSYNAEVAISNPSKRNLRVELELADPRKAKTTSLSLPLEVIDNCVYCYLTKEDVFILGNGNGERMSIDVKAESMVSVPIKFVGNMAGQFSTLLHVYNNLTMYEAVWITGKAVQPQFRFGNRKSGSPTPLLFEMNEKYLTSCDKSASQPAEHIQVTTKRTFTARNTGEVPIMVEKFLIGGIQCEGYGFKVVDCSSFELKANSSRKVEIAFTPDFTMTRISHALVIKTNLSSEVNYTLLATVPASCLDACARALQRPFWEMHMKKMSVGVLAVAFIFVLIAACIDADKVLKDHVQNISKDKGPMQPPLDLRTIGMKPSATEEASPNGESAVNILERSAYKAAVASLKKRNVKRSSLISPMIAQTLSKEKAWAEEFAKKIGTVSTASPASDSRSATATVPAAAAPPTSTSESINILSKALQTMSSAASVATALTKPAKEKVEIEKVAAPRKPIIKDTSETSKAGSPDKNVPIEPEKKVWVKVDPPVATTEPRKQKPIVKKSKSVPLESVLKENEPSVVTFATKPLEKVTSRVSRYISKDKSELGQSFTERKSTEVSGEVLNGNTPKRSSPNNVERISPRTNAQQKKFGKTPGRERKKDANGHGSSKRKVPKFKGTAFQFTAPLEGSSSNNSSPTSPATSAPPATAVSNAWETNPAATFSNVVAQRASPKSEEAPRAPYNDCGSSKPAVEGSDQDTNNNNHEWNEADLKNHETFGPDAEEKMNSSPDLGPIGTKKSPSSTPVWEPFIGSNFHRPTASLSSQSSSNTSFFSSNFPIGANFDYTNQYLGGTSGLLEHVFEESQQFNNIPPNDVLLSWLQQERIRQQTGSWTPGTNRTWTPMGYQDDPLPTTLPGADQMNVWQPATPPSGIVRPPPGLPPLPLRSNRASPIIHQQQNAHAQHPQQARQQPEATNLRGNNTIAPLQPPYHPYASFNSIWSDAWNKQEKK